MHLFPHEVITVDVLKSAFDWIAIVVAVLSAVFVSWQAFETRRSVRVTSEALDVAEEEQNINRELLLESQRAGIDNEMPRLTFIVGQAASAFDGDQPPSWEGSRQALDQGSSWSLSQSPHASIGVRVSVSLRNDGPRQATVTLEATADPTPNREIVILPDTASSFVVERIHPLHEWARLAELYEGHETSPLPNESDFQLLVARYTFPGERGATETHVIIQTGSVLVPVQPGSDQWNLRAPAVDNVDAKVNIGVRTSVKPFTRIYLAAQSLGQELEARRASSRLDRKRARKVARRG